MSHIRANQDALCQESCSQSQNAGQLTRVGRWSEMVKHVAAKALKYGLIAGVAGAALFALLPGALLGPLASLISTFSPSGGEALMTKVGYAAIAGAKAFAPVGAILGALVGTTGASAAADDAEEERIASHYRFIARRDATAPLGRLSQQSSSRACGAIGEVRDWVAPAHPFAQKQLSAPGAKHTSFRMS